MSTTDLALGTMTDLGYVFCQVYILNISNITLRFIWCPFRNSLISLK